MIQPIDYERASKLIGEELPGGFNWYEANGLQFYPEYGDFRFVWQGATGLSAIIGKRKPAGIIARVAVEQGEGVQ